MGKFFNKILRKGRSFSNKMDQYQEAITFAEADAYESFHGQKNEKQREQKPGKLLVIGNGPTFTQDIIEYALEMAQRMSYEILAMNNAPLKCEGFTLFASSEKKNCQAFKEISEKNIATFRNQAEQKGISFENTIRFSTTEVAIEEVRKEYGEIEFVISKSEERQVAEQEEKREQSAKEIFVYSMI